MSKQYEPSDEMAAQLGVIENFGDYKQIAGELFSEFGRTREHPTGWPEFNDYLGGGFGQGKKGELVVVAGGTGIGKSTFVYNLMTHFLGDGKRVHLVTLENPPEDAYNAICTIMGWSTLTPEFESKITAPRRELIFGGPAWNAEDLLLHMKHVAKTRGVKLFFVDHLNFMFENEEQVANENLRMAVVAKKLSNFCYTSGVIVVVVCHIRKGPNTKNPREVSIDDVRGSSAIAGAGTKVLALAQEAESIGDMRLVKARLLKSRYTATPRTDVQFDATRPAWEVFSVT